MTNTTIHKWSSVNETVDQIWPATEDDLDLRDLNVQQEAINVFLNPANVGTNEYLIASIRADIHGKGSWYTVCIMEEIGGEFHLVIKEPGKSDVVVPRSDTASCLQAINTQLTSLLDGTNNIQPTSDYRRNGS